MELLKLFCTPNWPDIAKKALNPDWQSVADFLLLEAFRRRVGATNEESAGSYDAKAKYACEYWRINACVMVIGTKV